MAGVISHATRRRSTVQRRIVGDARITVERMPHGLWKWTTYRPDDRVMGGPDGWRTPEAAFEDAIDTLRREGR
jgi:hypothetical protein